MNYEDEIYWWAKDIVCQKMSVLIKFMTIPEYEYTFLERDYPELLEEFSELFNEGIPKMGRIHELYEYYVVNENQIIQGLIERRTKNVKER